MSRMNWSKASKTSQVRNSGFEQGSEFGDVIDRNRKAATLLNIRLSSGSTPPPPSPSKKKKQKPKTKPIITQQSPKQPQKKAATQAITTSGYLQELVGIYEKSGALTAYQTAIDDFVSQQDKSSFASMSPATRRLVEGLLLIRLRMVKKLEAAKK